MNIFNQSKLLSENSNLVGKKVYYVTLTNNRVSLVEDIITGLVYNCASGDICVNLNKGILDYELRLSDCTFSLEEAIKNFKQCVQGLFNEVYFNGDNYDSFKIASKAKDAEVGDYVLAYLNSPLTTSLTLEQIKKVVFSLDRPVVLTDAYSCPTDRFLDRYIGFDELCKINDKTGNLEDVEPTILWGHPSFVSFETDGTGKLSEKLDDNIKTVLTLADTDKKLSLVREELNYHVSDNNGNILCDNIVPSSFNTVKDLIDYMKNL